MRIKLIILLISYSLTSYSQDIQSLITKANEYSENNPIEKLHLHTDRKSYTAGETIWFKIYEVIGLENLLSNVSNIAHVELIDPKNEVVNYNIVPVINGLGFSDITLTDTLTEGTYRLRAYTNWMRNDSTAYFFEQNVPISNGRGDYILTESKLQDDNYTISLQDLSGKPLQKASTSYHIEKEGKEIKKGKLSTDENGNINIPFAEKYHDAKLYVTIKEKDKKTISKVFKLPGEAQNSIQFFPEGGNLLTNTFNKIAVKTLKPNGLGISATVYILKGTDTIAQIQTNRLGMGSSLFSVEKNFTYTAFTKFEDGSIVESQLPKTIDSGYSIQVNGTNPNRLYAQVNISEDKQDGQPLYFILHNMGRVFHATKQNATKNELIFSAAKEQLPNGVLTVTILDGNLTPIIERPFFMFNEKNNMPLKVSMLHNSMGTRTQQEINIRSGNPQDSLQNATLSASIVNRSKTQEPQKNEYNILTQLLLSNDLHGFIEEPTFYFDKEIKQLELDDLMLSQGWRKITFDSIPKIHEPTFTAEKGLSIKGQARKLGRKAAFPNAKMTLISTNDFMNYIDTIANQEGQFDFGPLIYPDTVKFLITAKDHKGKNNIDILFTDYEKPLIKKNRNSSAELNNINTQLKKEIDAGKDYFSHLESQGLMEKAVMIEEITVSRRVIKKASEHSSNLNGSGNADQIINAEDLATCTSLDACLNGRLMGVMFQNGKPHSTRGGGEMQVILDGMYIEGDQLSMISPMDVESIEVLRNVNYTAIYGSYGGNGVIVITTKRGTTRNLNYTPKGILTIQPRGIHINREFYKPEYETQQKHNFEKDLRTTIHWEPNIVTDNEGRASFSFYTADEPGQYSVVIEGIDLEGRIGRKVVEFEVK
ncbi:TonB-dependent receptor plug domain-containing protein [Sphingobacterium sp. UT-1RO-CII-1]|uniref:TonB-dependent receptor plug domain-containing protein n=1 Tax=Sphingobacterium sp. UT-1RO-CII-1 TaxID=2995225 RepID=UPI00227B1929|nr:TonB-dependent receptor plug domain-containing protein [Sphingobacterium sp. UT-1RO-CII-1]MCY4778667.1 TonB-dependent receptor plug domain-containing protein [Sphingobacterium sp. UT-1RO-CII-1]